MLGWDKVQTAQAGDPPDAPIVASAVPAAAPVSVKRFVVQLDNTFGRDGPASEASLRGLRQLGDRFAIVSPNSRDTARSFAAKLRRLGLDLPESRILLAGEQTLRLVGQRHPRAACLFSASRVLTHAARSAGLHPVQRDADVVIIGRDTGWSYQRLELIANEVARGAALYATNHQPALRNAEGRLLPDTGSMIAAVEAVTGVRAQLVIGDPPVELFRLAAMVLDVAPADLVVVRPDKAASEADTGPHPHAMSPPTALWDWPSVTRVALPSAPAAE